MLRKFLGVIKPASPEAKAFDAINGGDAAALKSLLAAGLSPDATDPEDGRDTLLGRAVLMRNREAVRTLLEAGADPNRRGQAPETPLHSAALFHDGKTIKALLRRGAEIDARESSGDEAGHGGRTPLHAAAGGNGGALVETVSLLLEKDADTRLRDDHGQSPLHYLAKAARARAAASAVNADIEGDSVQALTELLDNVMIVSEGVESGSKRLDSSPTDLECAQLLIDAGVSVHDADASGVTPLMIALRNNDQALANFLRSRGAVISPRQEAKLWGEDA